MNGLCTEDFVLHRHSCVLAPNEISSPRIVQRACYVFIPYSPNFYCRCSNPLVIFHVPKKERRKGIAEAESKEMSLERKITIVGLSGGRGHKMVK